MSIRHRLGKVDSNLMDRVDNAEWCFIDPKSPISGIPSLKYFGLPQSTILDYTCHPVACHELPVIQLPVMTYQSPSCVS